MSDYNFLTPYIRARYSLLYLTTVEEARAEAQISHAVEESSTADRPMTLVSWSCTTGATEVDTKKPGTLPEPLNDESTDPIVALNLAKERKKSTVFLFKDLHPFLENPMVRRLLREISKDFRIASKGDKPLKKTMILLSPITEIPEDLKHDITLLDLELPGPDILQQVVEGIANTPKLQELIGGEEGQTLAVEACRGLTTVEAQDAVSKSLIVRKMDSTSKSVVEMIMHEKAQALKKTGLLEYYPTKFTMGDVGGLANLKAWLDTRQKAFTKEARDFGLPTPRGILMLGVPGTGKSLCAKAAAAHYGVPLMRMDVGKLFSGIVGSSEQNVRTAISIAESIGKSVLWLDELDKAFAGIKDGYVGDSGVTQRIFGTLITWMQEKVSPVFIMATANKVEGLPPELLRKGRFDEVFFVDLPTTKEREDILNIHIKKRRPKLILKLDKAVEVSEGFSGAEIEEAINAAMYKAFYTGSELRAELIVEAITKTVPLSQSRKEDIDRLREWATTNTVSASHVEEPIALGSRDLS